jgi:NTE family protein
MTEKLGLVLSGGGAPAAYFGAGVVQAIEEAGLRPSVYSGVSAGAINACALGVGMGGDALAEMWQTVRWQDIYRPRTDFWNLINPKRLLAFNSNPVEYILDAIGWTWLLNTAPARTTLTDKLGGERLTPTADKTVVVSAVDSNNGDVVRFCTALPPERRASPEFRLVDLNIDHLMGSFAVPLLFPPGHNHGHEMVDAGLVANTPLAPILRYEPDAVIIVSGAGVKRPAPDPQSWAQSVELLADNVAHFALRSDYDHAQTANTLARQAPQATKKKPVSMLMIEPAELPFSLGGFLHFSAAQAKEIIEYGRQEGGKAIAGWSR